MDYPIAAIVITHGLMVVGVVIITSVVMALVGIVLIEMLEAPVRVFKVWLKKVRKGFLADAREEPAA